MIKLQQDIQQQQRAVSEFAEALEIIKTQPRYKPAELAPLKILENMLAESTDDAERSQKLAAANEALDQAKQKLIELEQQWAERQAAAKVAEVAIDAKIAEFNDLARRVGAIAVELQNLFVEHAPALRGAHENVQLGGLAAVSAIPQCDRLGGSVTFRQVGTGVKLPQGPWGV